MTLTDFSISHPEILLADIILAEDEGLLRFGNSLVELVFSLQTGGLIAGIDRGKGEKRFNLVYLEMPAMVIRVGGKLETTGVIRNSRMASYEGVVEIGHQLAYHDHRVVQGVQSVSLEVTGRQGEWLLTSIFTLKPADYRIARDCCITYLGEGEVVLRDVRLILPGLFVGDEQEARVEAPGYQVPSHYPLSSIPEGVWKGLDSRPDADPRIVQHSVDAPGSMVGLVGLHNPNRQVSVLAWPYSTTECSIMEMEKRLGSINLVQWLLLSDTFTKGYSLNAGRQMISFSPGDWLSVLLKFQEWYAEVDLAVPSDLPRWADGTAIYEVHVGRAPFLDGRFHEPYPKMADLDADLERIAQMGFEVLQLMPHFPFCGYSVHHYDQIDQQYGDEAELRAVIQHAHQLGMKVILDVVLHGCVDKEIVRWDMRAFGHRYDFIFGEWLKAADEHSVYRQEHPEWFMQDENGETARIYTWAFDHGSHSFQDYLVEVLRNYLSNLNVDGFRFDAPTWNCIPNWNPDCGYRPGSAYYASYGLMQRLRSAIKPEFPDALFYTEPGGPLFRNTIDLTYNYDEDWLSGSIIKVVSERGYAGARCKNGCSLNAQQVALWLLFRNLSLPPGSQTVHHLDSHDTFWWGEMAQFRHEAFGIQPSRAMFAFYAMLGGGIMVYAGAESGSEEYYSRLVNLRQKTPSLRYGSCDFLAVECHQSMVLSWLRTYGAEHTIVLINFSDADVNFTLDIPSVLPGFSGQDPFILFDLLNEEYIQSGDTQSPKCILSYQLELALSAYGVRILKLCPSNHKWRLAL
jgi:hypothetical protein